LFGHEYGENMRTVLCGDVKAKLFEVYIS